MEPPMVAAAVEPEDFFPVLLLLLEAPRTQSLSALVVMAAQQVEAIKDLTGTIHPDYRKQQ